MTNRIPQILFSVLIACALLPVAPGAWAADGFGKEIALRIRGIQPHCAVDAGGALHVVYRDGKKIKYFTVSSAGRVSSQETLPGSAKGFGPWVTVIADGSVHVVWDNQWTNAFYTNRIGGTWKRPVQLPKKMAQRNHFAQVTGGYTNDQVHISTWNNTKGTGDNSSIYRVTNLAAAVPTVICLAPDEDGSNRAPSILGPTAAARGDGQVHAYISGMRTSYKLVQRDGSLQGNLDISRTPQKTGEGRQGFFIGRDVALVTDFDPGGKVGRGVALNTLSRKKVVIIERGLEEMNFPRAAYDPVGRKVYILYPRHGKPRVATWDPATGNVSIIGDAAADGITFGWGFKARGVGAGGIAVRQGGGAHIIYSIGRKLFYRSVNAGK